MREAVHVEKPWFAASLWEWIFTTDHKKIGIMYGVTSTVFFIVAGLMALGMRVELFNPGAQYLKPETYNWFLTVHGAVILLWWAIGIWASFANFFIPLMIGARDVAFPRLNALGYWIFFAASVIALLTFIPGNQIMTMWTGYPPLSSTEGVGFAGQTALFVFIWHLTGFASIAGAVNFITTVISMRQPGIGFFNLNLFIHGIMAANVIQLLGVPSVAGAVTMLFLDTYLNTSFFDPNRGGDPVLYQNLFWFYSHPAVYVMVLPAFGIISEVVSALARKPIFGYRSMVVAIWAIALVGFMVWTHHMFVSGIPDWVKILMSYTTLLIAVPTGIKIFNWVATFYRAAIRYETPMLYAIGAILMFLIGGLTGIPLGIPAFDVAVHDSYFVVGHFHYVLGMAVTLSAFAGFFYWWPKITGKMYPEKLGKLSFWIVMIGSNVLYFAQLVIGIWGMPRRYYDYPPIESWTELHQLQTYGAFILAFGILLAVVALIKGALSGEKAPQNPWMSNSLEWRLPSPPPPHNFDEPPKVEEDYCPHGYCKF
ncbi:cbb3-type cytochrome c oxidase subunit I [Hydrogenivirga sp. 128-5-R1-1]|uniref:cytochrome c oxidase subunit I n=1 Tax=Hydrogenivirga sp. 128-5-R1-1 TaxID=392423 RepID=UPI00015EF771|nr:cbb3-type cytochrome c oxidase subunit I [Hydrogenivirga sp. 128-5-R1-1]EDP75666.1 cytochrome c oxidase subunit I [Hydrogenivirga sp. 128-5-R1-1]